jgi:hypothetical protein
MKMKLTEVEKYLDGGCVWVRVKSRLGHQTIFWKCRRSGKTKLWKTRPDHFRIPIKAGMYESFELTHESDIGVDRSRGDFVVAQDDPSYRGLTGDQKKEAKLLLKLRPPVLPGSRAILDAEAAKQWHALVVGKMNELRIDGPAIHDFCNIAGVAD